MSLRKSFLIFVFPAYFLASQTTAFASLRFNQGDISCVMFGTKILTEVINSTQLFKKGTTYNFKIINLSELSGVSGLPEGSNIDGSAEFISIQWSDPEVNFNSRTFPAKGEIEYSFEPTGKKGWFNIILELFSC